MITPAFSKALVSCSHTRTLTGSSDEIIVCYSVVVLIVVVAGGMRTNEIPPSEASALKPTTSIGCFEVLVFPPSLKFSIYSVSEDGELINTHTFISIPLDYLSVTPGRFVGVVSVVEKNFRVGVRLRDRLSLRLLSDSSFRRHVFNNYCRRIRFVKVRNNESTYCRYYLLG